MLSVKEINLLLAQNEGYRVQNKSLQKENAALKGILDAYKMSENEANEIIAELKAKNEKLKEEVRTEKIYSSQIEELEESLNHLKQENERLKNALQEIKEIAESGKKFAERWMITGEQKANVLAYANRILDLITKAESEG